MLAIRKLPERIKWVALDSVQFGDANSSQEIADITSKDWNDVINDVMNRLSLLLMVRLKIRSYF